MNIIAGILVLSICIIVHELGHLLLGKLVGIKARVFSFGYGKGIFKKQFGDTTYQITAIPLGGYVQFCGDEISKREESKPGDFYHASPLRRIIPIVGGPLFNLILGILIFAVFNFIGMEKPTTKIMVPPKLEYVQSETGEEKSIPNPSRVAGLRTGDVITHINGEKIETYSDLKVGVIFSSKSVLNIEFVRDGKRRSVNITPIRLKEGGYPIIGVQPFGLIGLEKVLEDGSFHKAGALKGDLILAIDGKRPESMSDLAKLIQKNGNKTIKLEIDRKGRLIHKDVFLKTRETINFSSIKLFQDRATDLNVRKIFHLQKLEGLIKSKTLKIGDKVVKSRLELLDKIKEAGERKRALKFSTGSGEYLVRAEIINPGYAGVIFRFMKVDTKKYSYGFFPSIGMGVLDAWDFVTLNIKGIAKLFSGELSVRENLSGPIKIAKIAGDVAAHGAGPLFLFLAQISVVLMIMNLLPIPVVDGGHIVFFLVEAVMGRPLNQKLQERIMAFGVVFLVTLGVYVVLNDILSLDFVKNLMATF